MADDQDLVRVYTMTLPRDQQWKIDQQPDPIIVRCAACNKILGNNGDDSFGPCQDCADEPPC